MLPGMFFTTWRFFEIVTLIPVIGMLSWFVHGYTENNMLTPAFILTLFIVSVLAGFWAIMTLLAYGMTKHNGHFVAFVDLVFVGAFIAGVYELRGITDVNCASFGRGEQHQIFTDLGVFGSLGVQFQNPLSVNLNKNCAMLKASFAFGIMNILFFFVTFLLALWIARHHRNDYRHSRTVRREVVTRSHHSSRSPRHHHHSPSRHHSSRHSSSRHGYII